MKTGIIVIDPGHSGRVNAGGSDANCAVSVLSDLVGISILQADQLKLKIHQVILPGNQFIYYLRKTEIL